jgi:hypothetical protein
MGRRPYAEREVETPLGSEIYRLQKIKLTYEAGGQKREEGGQDAGHCDGQVYHTWPLFFVLALKMTIIRDFQFDSSLF